MAKVHEEERRVYFEKVKVYNAMTKASLKTETDIVTQIKRNPAEGAMKKLTLVNEMLNLASVYMAINGVSSAILKVKNEEALNDARKSLYKAIIYLEEIVSNYIDASFSEYEDKLVPIESFDENQRYRLIRKIGLTIDMLQAAYGDNSKWKWTFVEIEGRFATTCKNILDLRNAVANSRPDSPYYDSTVFHLRLVKELLSRAASRYRDKYELSTQQVLDFKTGMSYLGALKRIHIVLAESEDAEEIKKKIAVWNTKLETDIKKQEEAKKKKK